MRRSRVGIAAALVVAASLLAGCTGDGQVAAFDRAFSSDPAVDAMELTSHDNQPFTGGVSGEVVARAGLSDVEFTALVDRIGAYTRENGERMRGRIVVGVDGFEIEVTGDDAATLDVLLALRSDPRVLSAEARESSVAAVGVDAGSAVEVARSLPSLVGDGPSLFVRSEDRAVDLGDSAADLAAALAVWDAIDVPLGGMRLRDGELTVTLQQESDLARAQAAVPAGDPAARFASELIRLGESDGARARSLVSALDPAVLARIASVWESGTRLQIAVRSAADVDAVAGAVADALPAGTTEAWVQVDGDGDSRVDLVEGASAR